MKYSDLKSLIGACLAIRLNNGRIYSGRLSCYNKRFALEDDLTYESEPISKFYASNVRDWAWTSCYESTFDLAVELTKKKQEEAVKNTRLNK